MGKKKLEILAKVGTHGLAKVRVVEHTGLAEGDRLVIMYEDRECRCIIDKVQGGAPSGRPIYFLSRH